MCRSAAAAHAGRHKMHAAAASDDLQTEAEWRSHARRAGRKGLFKEGMKMWYVMQVRTGTEEKIRDSCLAGIPGPVLESCFIPRIKEQRKLHGEWSTKEKIMFPGYVFVVTGDLNELFCRLKEISGLTKLLKTGDEFVPLTEEERDFILQFGGEDHIVEISRGILTGSSVKVISGPLMGKEGLIKKINYHKRKALLEMEMFRQRQVIEVGLEVIMEKK